VGEFSTHVFVTPLTILYFKIDLIVNLEI